jgi:DNA-binding transcriptional MerR regulator/methylmalonyl-CoA mutase cobalamin-binding subunit
MPDNDRSARYSIKAVSQATGLTVETLRAWERRYRIVEPKRDPSGHRVYTACDVSRLRRLRETTERGHPISKVAHLSNEHLGCLLSDRDSDHPNCGAAQAFVARILCAVDKYLPEECDLAIAMAFSLLPAADVVREVLTPSLRETGERWRRGQFTIGQERLLSSAVRRQVGAMLQTYSTVARGATVVFATVTGEQHELGIMMHAALAASNRLRSFYLGADLPPEEIANLACRANASAVAISMVMPDEMNLSLQQLAVLRRCLPANVEIWIGGAASCYVDPSQFPAGSIHMSGRRDFEHRVELLAAPGR